MAWVDGLAQWQADGIAYLSVAFSWKLHEAANLARYWKERSYRVRAGGPALMIPQNAKVLQGLAEIGGEVDALLVQVAEVGRLKVALGTALPYLIRHSEEVSGDDQRVIWHGATDPIGAPEPPSIVIPIEEYRILNQVVAAAREAETAHCHDSEEETCSLAEALTELDEHFGKKAKA